MAKASELRAKDVAALETEIKDLLKSHFNLRMQHATQQLAQLRLVEARRCIEIAAGRALLQQGVATSRMVSTVFDGIARHTPEGHAFVADAREHGFREAVRHRDEPLGDHGRRASGV